MSETHITTYEDDDTGIDVTVTGGGAVPDPPKYLILYKPS